MGCVQERITNKKAKIHRKQLTLFKLTKLVKIAFCSSSSKLY